MTEQKNQIGAETLVINKSQYGVSPPTASFTGPESKPPFSGVQGLSKDDSVTVWILPENRNLTVSFSWAEVVPGVKNEPSQPTLTVWMF